MNVEKYKIERVPSSQDQRFQIVDEKGKVVDDAQGYGYKTSQSALKARWYKFGGGKEKINEKKQKQKDYFRSNPGLKEHIEEMYLCSFKEIARGEINEDDLISEIKRVFGIDMPKEYLMVNY